MASRARLPSILFNYQTAWRAHYLTLFLFLRSKRLFGSFGFFTRFASAAKPDPQNCFASRFS
jgi:hypothetical protein